LTDATQEDGTFHCRGQRERRFQKRGSPRICYRTRRTQPNSKKNPNKIKVKWRIDLTQVGITRHSRANCWPKPRQCLNSRPKN